MRVVVVGAGKVGKYIATDLAAAGHQVLVLDSSKDVVARAQNSGEHVGVDFRVADACEIIRQAAVGLQYIGRNEPDLGAGRYLLPRRFGRDGRGEKHGDKQKCRDAHGFPDSRAHPK